MSRHKVKRCTGPFNDFFFDTFDAGTQKSQRRIAIDRTATTAVILILIVVLAALRLITGV